MPKGGEALARGIAHFNAARYADAEAAFLAAQKLGAGTQADFFLERARRAIREDPAGFDADSAALRAAAREGKGATAAAKRLAARSPSRAFRIYRDLWLSGEGKPAPEGRSPWDSFLKSSRLWRAGRDKEALKELARAGRMEGFSWMLYQSAEILLRRLERPDDALAALELARAGSPWLWEASCLEAEIRAGRGEADALAPLDALAPPPGSESSFFAWRGAVRLWTRGGTAALPDLEKGADTMDGTGWRGAAKVHAGDVMIALSDLDRRLDAEADPEAFCWRGEVHAALGRRDAARRDYASALAMSDGWFWARIGRALLNIEAGEAPGEDWLALAGPAAPPERAKELLAAARAAAQGLRRPDFHLQGFWLEGAASPSDWFARRLAA